MDQIKLNQAEQAIVDGLPEALRAGVVESLLAAKREAFVERTAFRMKATEKGALSVYTGKSRFPTTLYKGQWEVILQHAGEIGTAIKQLPERKQA